MITTLMAVWAERWAKECNVIAGGTGQHLDTQSDTVLDEDRLSIIAEFI